MNLPDQSQDGFESSWLFNRAHRTVQGLGRKTIACKVHGLKYLKVDTLSIKVVPDDLYYDYNNLAET